MSTTEDHSNDASGIASVRNVDMKLEVVVIPVSDVDRAKEFYGGLGWRLDADVAAGDDFRLVQFTPPGSGCSIQFGTNLTSAAPGSAQGLYLIVSDIEAARDELVAHGVEVSEVFHEGTPGARFHDVGRVAGRRPIAAATARSPRSAIRTATAGCSRRSRRGCPAALTRRRRPIASASDLAGALRRAAAAHGEHEKRIGRGRPELARLVRRIHGARAGRRRTAVVSELVGGKCSFVIR